MSSLKHPRLVKLLSRQYSSQHSCLHHPNPALPQHLLRNRSARPFASSTSPFHKPRLLHPPRLSRPFTTSPSSRHPAKTVEQARSNHRSGPFSAPAAILFLIAGCGLIFYFRTEKARMERKKIAEQSKGVGKPKVGGPFELIDQNGEKFGDADMKGGFSIVYFGFTHCPDICPDELDKLAKIIDLVNARAKTSISSSRFLPMSSSPTSSSTTNASTRAPLLPLFISCDPARDTPAVLKTYLSEFHPGIVGLTGTWEQTKDVCKAYRVYFSTPPNVKAGEDYLVDHSIYFYVMDPEGDFVEAIGRQHSPETAAKLIMEHMGDWEGGKKKE